MATLSMAEAREQLTRLPERLADEPDMLVQVTRRGKPVLAVLSWDLYESLVETLEVMADPEAMAALRASAEQIARGEFADVETVKTRLGLS